MDHKEERKRQQFMIEVNRAIALANREVIHQTLASPISADQVIAFAVSVARVRARYLEAAFKITEKNQNEPLGEGEIDSLKRQRQAYEEARDAFEALTHAIERGYVDLAD